MIPCRVCFENGNRNELGFPLKEYIDLVLQLILRYVDTVSPTLVFTLHSMFKSSSNFLSSAEYSYWWVKLIYRTVLHVGFLQLFC